MNSQGTSRRSSNFGLFRDATSESQCVSKWVSMRSFAASECLEFPFRSIEHDIFCSNIRPALSEFARLKQAAALKGVEEVSSCRQRKKPPPLR